MTTDYESFQRGQENKRIAALAVKQYRTAAYDDLVAQAIATRGVMLEPPPVAVNDQKALAQARADDPQVVYDEGGKYETTNTRMAKLLAGGKR